MAFSAHSRGTVQVFPEKLVLEVDPEIVRLTRALLPPMWRTTFRPQRYEPHITISREEVLPPIAVSLHGSEVEFSYDPEPVLGELYAWLRVESETLLVIRTSLGLPPSSPLSRPPDGEEVFHITLGNRKPPRSSPPGP